MASNNLLSPIPSTSSAKRTPDPQHNGSSASLTGTEVMPENKGDYDNPEPAAEGALKMEYSSD